jgi:amino acid transporter
MTTDDSQQIQVNVTAPAGEMLVKQLRWYDPFSMIVAAGVAVFITLGFTMAQLGTWGAVLVTGIVAIIALLQNVLWAEMAAMFPSKVGGITLFANEAWKRRFPPLGALSTFGYWCGWSLVLGVFGIGLGSLVQAQWFPTATWAWHTPWGVGLGLPQIIAIAAVLLAWLTNIVGIRVAAWVSWVLAASFGVVCAIFLIVPFAKGLWHPSSISWHVSAAWRHGSTGVQSVLIWLYVVGWSVYPSEMPATFAPEYRDTVKDTRRGLTACGIAYFLLWVVMPMTTTGGVGDKFVAGNPASFGVGAFSRIMGGGGAAAVAIMCAALFATMIAGSADASRALYGMALDGMTLRQLRHLNRRGMPNRALTVDAVVNCLIVFFVGNLLSVLLVANLGYFIAIIAALVGYVFLRRDQAGQPRAIRLRRFWSGVAVVLALVNAVLLFEGVTNPQLTGYGSLRTTLIAVVILALSLVLFFYRRMVQDRRSAPSADDQTTWAAGPGSPASDVTAREERMLLCQTGT